MFAQDYMGSTTGAVDGIWWTEHDWLLVNYAKLEAIRFTGLEEQVEVPKRAPNTDHPLSEITAGWRPVEGTESGTDCEATITTDRSVTHGSSMRMRVSPSDGQPTIRRWRLDVGGHRGVYPLYSEPTIQLAVYPESSAGHGAPFAEFVLSEQPPDLDQPRLQYVFGDCDDLDESNARRCTITVPVESNRWNEVMLEPAEDAAELDLPAQGLDNSLREIRLGLMTRGSSLDAYFDALHITPKYRGNELIEKQRELLNRLPTQLEHLVGVEISWVGKHINALGSDVPVPDYGKRDPTELDTRGVVEHIHDHGGVACYNHPDTSDVEAHAERLVREDAYGVEIIEVGRRNEDPRERLELWDLITRRGIAVTGVGVGDTHNATDGWEMDDPAESWWVTHVWADEFQEGSLLDALCAGRAYFARPAAFSGTIDIEGDEGIRMGMVAIGAEMRRLTATVTGGRAGDTIRWILNGETLSTISLDKPTMAAPVDIPPADGVRSVRWELHRSFGTDQESTIIACSNPVILLESPDVLSSTAASRRSIKGAPEE